MFAWCLVTLPGAVDAQFFFDSFDSYLEGSTISGQGGWETWAGDPAANTLVVNSVSYSPANSLAVSGTADIVHQFAGVTTGTWYARLRVYVPSTQLGELYFTILNRYDGGTCGGTDCNWSVQLAMCRSGCGGVSPGTATSLGGSDVPGTGSTPLLSDQWVDVVVEINLDMNQYSIWYNNILLDTLPWTVTGDLNVAAFNLFANGSTESYMDDVWLDTMDPTEPFGPLFAVDDDTDSLYSVDRSTGAARMVGPCGEDLSASGLAWDSWHRKMYVSDVTLGGGAWGLGTVNLGTGAVTVVGDHVNSTNIGGLAFDSTNNVLYAADQSNECLAEIDRATGVSTCVGGTWGGPTGIYGLAYNNHTDTLFGINPTLLYTVDTITGVATAVGPHGMALGQFFMGLEFDSESGLLFASGTGDSNLYALNMATGASIPIGPTGLSYLSGLASTTAPLEPVIFSDGFELGNTSFWSAVIP
jgi:hypothetical protein